MPNPIWKRSEIWGLAIALLTLLVVIVLGYHDWNNYQIARSRVSREQATLSMAADLLSSVKDLETGQRGYLLAGRAPYLAPYEAAGTVVQARLAELEQQAAGDGVQREHVRRIGDLLRQKVAELQKTIDLRRTQGLDAALAVVDTGEGKALMDALRQEVAALQVDGRRRLAVLEREEDYYRWRSASVAAGGSALLFVMLVIAAMLVRTRSEARERALAAAASGKREVELVRDLLDTTLRSIGDAVITTDPDERITFLNAVAQELTGWNEECLGKPLDQVFRIINEHTRATVESPVEKVRRTGMVAGLANHTLLLARDGREVPIDDSGAPIRNRDGKTIGFVLVFRDITDRKAAENALRESEDRFRTLVAGTTSMVWGTDANGACDAPQPGWEEFTGQTFEQYRGFGGSAAIHPEDRDLVAAAWQAAVQARRGYTVEFRLWHAASQQYHYVNSRGVPLFDAGGNIRQWIGTITDVTDRRRLEEKLQQAAKLESLGVLAGGIAHDFNNLLVGILGNASLLQSIVSGAEQQEIAGQILSAGERAAALTGQMLAYSGRGRFVVEPTDLSAETRQIVLLVRSSVPKHVDVILDLAQGLPPVDVDRAQFQQLVMNLVINGAEAIDAAHGKVTVATRTVTLAGDEIATRFEGEPVQPGTYVVLEVRDTGIGMTAETRGKIFEPFFTTKFTGRGLGLAAVMGIVRGHKGAIEVISEPGAGSTFRLFFRGSAHPLVAAPPEGPAAPAPGRPVVLVVDDEEVVRRMAHFALSRHGFEVLLANHGREAIDVFAANADAVSAILLDLTMPVMSGEEALPRLREIRPGVRILASSGYNQSEAARRFGGAIDGFVQKPYSAQKLLAALRAALQNTPASGPLA